MKRKCNCGAFLPEGGKCSRCGAQIEMPKPNYCDDHCVADELRAQIAQLQAELAAEKSAREDASALGHERIVRLEADSNETIQSWKDWHRQLVDLIPGLEFVERKVTLQAVRELRAQADKSKEKK